MTVVNPKSISGINSITMASGSDNLLTIHTTNTTERLRINSSGDVIVGSGITLSQDGDIFTTGITTFTNDVQFVGNSGISSITYDKSANQLNFVDNTKARFGSGGDLEIYHNGSASYIDEGGTGALYIRGSDLYLTDEDGTNMLYAANNGGVSLYYGGGVKLATNSDGVGLGDNVKLRLGDAPDYKIYHNGSHTYHENYTGDLYIKSDQMYLMSWTSGEQYLHAVKDGRVALFYDNTMQCETSSVGLKFPSGKGIDFSLASDASGVTSNLLDDYEEGTWTPSFTDGSVAASSYTQRHGWYTRIGNTVYVWFRLQDIDTSGLNGGNTAYITGLPFPIAQSTGRITTGHLELSNANVESNCFGVSIFANTGSSANSYFRMFQMRDGVGHSSINVGVFTDDDNEVNGEFFYVT